jgi:1-aminocyclopropane-1-carboxylate deaminase
MVKGDCCHYLIKKIEQQLFKSPVEVIQHPLLQRSGVELFIKREDQLHPVVSGNKWRKLKYILNHALKNNHDHLISMGGPWSNHLHALAWVGNKTGLRTTGIIRGECPDQKSSTLIDMERWGMQLEFVSRIEFRKLREFHSHDSPPADQYNGYWIPEGGSSDLALRGIAEMVEEIDIPFDTIALACGTGTTLAGVSIELPDQKKALGFAALKGADF